MQTRLPLMVTLLLAAAGPALATTCPPKGARYVADNFVRRDEIVSLGSAHNPTLGCQWLRVTDNQEIWLNLGATVTPLAGATPPAAARPATPTPATAPSGTAPSGSASGAIERGVYACDMGFMSGGVVMALPQTGAMFGIVDDRTYRDFNGGTGAYRYEAATSELVMTSGPLRAQRYKRSGATAFKPMDARGATGPINCPLNRSKPMDGKW